jgi:hypothetical protein
LHHRIAAQPIAQSINQSGEPPRLILVLATVEQRLLPQIERPNSRYLNAHARHRTGQPHGFQPQPQQFAQVIGRSAWAK